MTGSQTRMTVHTHAGTEHYVYEGEAIMSQGQQDRFKALLGDGLSKVTVGCDFAEKDYGNGGGVVVSVTLTCDQSEQAVRSAIGLAQEISYQYAWYYRDMLRQQLVQAGVLKP